MSSLVSGDSSVGDESIEESGGELNPIEIDDSTSSNSESESDSPSGAFVLSGTNQNAKNEYETKAAKGNHSGEDGDEEYVEGEDEEESNSNSESESVDVDETEGNYNMDGEDDNDDEKDDDETNSDPIRKASPKASAKTSGETSTMPEKVRKHIWGDIESMLEIKKSPYEGYECAEVGEDCFEELRTMLHYTGKRNDEINPKLAALVGDKLALDLYKAHYEIGKSGILYSANWREGKIRDGDFGLIPKGSLLLCLHEHRFARGSESLLQAVARNLECTRIVLEAMDTWHLTEDFPNLLSTKDEDSFVFATQKSSCYKCEIFVARAFQTLLLLNKTHEVSSVLTKKIKECLALMNKHVRPNQTALARMRDKPPRSTRRARAPARVDRARKSRTPDEGEGPGHPSPPAAAQEKKTKRPSRRRRAKAETGGGNPPKRRRKVQDSGERMESLLMLFDNMQSQIKRICQMMTFYGTQLRDHRDILRDEIMESLLEGEKSSG
ncbi:unnamed protein product [Pseudo-nitzschia multistriata]|uniref:Uncharacterized protein n=1 Tax=Pseudo-nitzschia multistriata TaxID=183589 RepID=A0A448ZDX2_9STRA|nr:unnamed protein product [Pseudo-nitzschia multistriata]